MKTKQLAFGKFYKSVREDYTSVWAPPPLGRTYVIGKTYQFPVWAPAHITLNGNWHDRPEQTGSTRLIICEGYYWYGQVTRRHIEYFVVDDEGGEEYGTTYQEDKRWLSCKFKVVGEVERPNPYYGCKIDRYNSRVSPETIQFLKERNPKRIIIGSMALTKNLGQSVGVSLHK